MPISIAVHEPAIPARRSRNRVGFWRAEKNWRSVCHVDYVNRELLLVVMKLQLNGKESETGILLVFKDRENSDRHAAHIENKPPQGKWRPGQPENHRIRARDRMSKLQYVDWQVTLIAPLAFLKVSLSLAVHFDFAISCEALETSYRSSSTPDAVPPAFVV
jgi:hypothetical protein